MYSAAGKGVKGGAWVALALFSLTSGHAHTATAQALADLSCDKTLQALFTPPFPRIGRYEACVSPRKLTDLVPSSWQTRELDPLDAFGKAGSYNRSALAQLYGGQLAQVARGWTMERGQFESRTYISPYPDARLARLMPGTLILRFMVCCT